MDTQFEFKKLDPDVLSATKDEWLGILESEAESFSPSGYYQFLDSAQARLGNGSAYPYSYCFAVTDAGCNKALGLFDVSQAHKGQPQSWLKVLAMRTSPKFDYRSTERPGDSRIDRSRSVSKVLTFGLGEILKLSETSEFKARKVKIFGNKQTDTAFFTTLADRFAALAATQTDGKLAFELEAYGSWLEIIKNEAC